MEDYAALLADIARRQLAAMDAELERELPPAVRKAKEAWRRVLEWEISREAKP